MQRDISLDRTESGPRADAVVGGRRGTGVRRGGARGRVPQCLPRSCTRLPLIAPIGLTGGVARPGRAGRESSLIAPQLAAEVRAASDSGIGLAGRHQQPRCDWRPGCANNSTRVGARRSGQHRRHVRCRRHRLRPRRGPVSSRRTQWDLPASARVREWPAGPVRATSGKPLSPLPLRRPPRWGRASNSGRGDAGGRGYAGTLTSLWK